MKRAALTTLLLAASCAKHPPPNTLSNWEPPQPPAGMRMTLFSGAEIEAPESDAVKGGDPKKTLKMPIVMAYVEHPSGSVLIDTAFGRNFERHVEEFPANLFRWVMNPKFDPEKDSAVMQLAALGVGSEDVDYLAVTHMHWDHIGGLGDFPQATLLTPHAEWNAAHRGDLTLSVRGYADSMYDKLNPAAMLIEWPDRPFGTFERSLDLFGDGSVVLIDTHGHTPGSMSILVSLPTGERFLFIGDAAWLRRGYREHKHKGWKTRLLDNSRRNVMPVLERIDALERLAPDVKVVPAHDPEVWAELKAAPYWYGGSETASLVDRVLAGGKSGTELAAMTPLERADFVYELVYGSDSPKVTPAITQAQHHAALQHYERKMEIPDWHVRAGVEGQAADGAARRFYLDLAPDGAADFADALCADLNAAKIPFTLKLPTSLAEYDRSSAGVLYVRTSDYAAAKPIVLGIAAKLPGALGPATPPFTKKLARGVAAAHEPDPALPAPSTREKHSFGTLRSDALAEAFGAAPASASREQLARLARERLVHYGIDPDRPWLNRASDPDDL